MAKQPAFCEHVFVNGQYCGSPALKSSAFCYWHHTDRARRERLKRERADAAPTLVLPLLEDENSIIITLQETVQALLDKRIDRFDANTIIYALQTCASVLPDRERRPPLRIEYVTGDPSEGEQIALRDIDSHESVLPPRKAPKSQEVDAAADQQA